MHFVVIPTAGTRQALLTKLIDASGVPRENIIIVATRPNVELPDGCRVIQDLGPINIQRWWNKGIDEAVRLGGSALAVCNDDLTINSETLPRLYEALQGSGATIASPLRPDKHLGLHRKRLVPYSPVLWGCLWVLNLETSLRPDEDFHWWYGDNDLDIRARRDFTGIVSVDVHFTHEHPGQNTGASEALLALAEADTETYERKYGRLLWLTHMYRRFLSRGVSGKDHSGT